MKGGSRKRVKAVRITREALTPLFRGELGIVAGLPDDVRVKRVEREPVRDTHLVILESKEFEPVAEGAEIPITTASTIGLNF